MKKLSLLALALSAGIPMLAQTPPLKLTSPSGESSITAYGVLDLTLAHVAHDATFTDEYAATGDPRPTKAATKAVTGIMNGGLSADRVGIKGDTTIGGNWKALFQLEMGFNLISGTLGNGALSVAQNVTGTPSNNNGSFSADSGVSGQLFGRSAFFGAASPTGGTLTAGRNTTFFTDLISDYEPTGGAAQFSPIGYSSSWSGGGGATDSARLDSSIKYALKRQGFNIGYMHKFGGVSGASSSRSADNLIAGYDNGNFGVQLGYMAVKDNTVLANDMTDVQSGTGTVTNTYTNADQLKVTFYDTRAILLMAKYKIGNLWIKGGWQHQAFKDPSNPAQDATMTSIYGQLVGKTVTNALLLGGAEQTKKLDIYWIGPNCDVTPKLNIALGGYYIKQNNFANGTGAANPADVAGNARFGSIILDYHIAKAFDVYAGYMSGQYREGMAAGYPLASNQIFGTGARYVF
ncbi:MAG: porin [Holophaga sp.]|nr:porin [Holophaga sp.]